MAMHGDKSQSQRERALARFERGDVDTLVATDVAARGIDVADVTHVINFDAPETATPTCTGSAAPAAPAAAAPGSASCSPTRRATCAGSPETLGCTASSTGRLSRN